MSRIDLLIEEVRIQRVQDISRDDAIAEGWPGQGKPCMATAPGYAFPWFSRTWDKLNAKPKPVRRNKQIDHYVSYPWDEIRETREHKGKPWFVRGNWWIFAYSFKRIKG
jgi:hypothetical protein